MMLPLSRRRRFFSELWRMEKLKKKKRTFEGNFRNVHNPLVRDMSVCMSICLLLFVGFVLILQQTRRVKKGKRVTMPWLIFILFPFDGLFLGALPSMISSVTVPPHLNTSPLHRYQIPKQPENDDSTGITTKGKYNIHFSFGGNFLFRKKGAHNLWISNDSIKKLSSIHTTKSLRRGRVGEKVFFRSFLGICWIWNIYFWARCLQERRQRRKTSNNRLCIFGAPVIQLLLAKYLPRKKQLPTQWNCYTGRALIAEKAFSISLSPYFSPFHNRFSHSKLFCWCLVVILFSLLSLASPFCPQSHPHLTAPTFISLEQQKKLNRIKRRRA